MDIATAAKHLKGAVLLTGGGLYSNDEGRTVEIERVEHYVDRGGGKTEHFLRVYFNPLTWDVNRDGLIYTDKVWLRELRRALRDVGYHSPSKVYYTEQGMQGTRYVHLIVGGQW